MIGWKDESEAVNVTTELVRRGYTEEQIAKLWGRNFLRSLPRGQAVSKRLNVAVQGESSPRRHEQEVR